MSTVYRDIASLEIGVNGRTTAGRPQNTMPLAADCWRRRHKKTR